MTHPSGAHDIYIQILVSISYPTSHKRRAGSPLASQENSVQKVINPLLACRGTELCIHNTHMPFPLLSYAKRIPLLSECDLGKCLWKCGKHWEPDTCSSSASVAGGDHTCITVQQPTCSCQPFCLWTHHRPLLITATTFVNTMVLH